MLEKRHPWRVSEGWLRMWDNPTHSATIDKTRVHLARLPWGQPLCALGAVGPAESLAPLLSDDLLGSDILDMLTAHLSTCVQQDSVRTKAVMIAPTHFAQSVAFTYQQMKSLQSMCMN